MDFPYTINYLESACNVKKQSIYALLAKNPQFRDSNKKYYHGRVYFSQAVLDYLLDYYSYYTRKDPVIIDDKVEDTSHSNDEVFLNQNSREGLSSSILKTETARGTSPDNIEQKPREGASVSDLESIVGETIKTASQVKIEALEAEIDNLKSQIEDLKQDKKELNENLGFLRLTLQQERLLYLPAPKKTISERIKGIFGKKKVSKE